MFINTFKSYWFDLEAIFIWFLAADLFSCFHKNLNNKLKEDFRLMKVLFDSMLIWSNVEAREKNKNL